MDDFVEEVTYVSGSLASKQSPRGDKLSKVSVSKSEVSMVDAKFQSNNVKSKLKSLFKNIDSDKTGCVKTDVFFQLLELHKISLSEEAKKYLASNANKNHEIMYKEAVNQITIDLNAATEDHNGQAKMVWIIQPLVQSRKSRSPIGDDSISQVAGSIKSGHILGLRRGSNGNLDTKSKGSFLSKDKLMTLDNHDELRSRID